MYGAKNLWLTNIKSAAHSAVSVAFLCARGGMNAPRVRMASILLILARDEFCAFPSASDFIDTQAVTSNLNPSCVPYHMIYSNQKLFNITGNCTPCCTGGSLSVSVMSSLILKRSQWPLTLGTNLEFKRSTSNVIVRNYLHHIIDVFNTILV